MINKLTFKTVLYTAVSLCFLSLASCKKDTDSVNSGTLLTKYVNGEDQLGFEYNADRSLRAVTVKDELVTGGAEMKYAVSYLPNKKIGSLNGEGGNRIQLNWDNSRLVGAETWIGNQRVSLTEYEYLNGVLKSVYVKMIYGADTLPFLKFSFIYNNAGNVGRMNTWTYNFLNGQLEFTGHADMEYDTNPGPFEALKEVMLVFWQAAAGNNVTKITQYAPGGEQEEETVYTYTYNSNRLPVSASVRTTTNGQPPVNSSLTFTYR